MELTKKQIQELRESFFQHNYNEEYVWGFISALKALRVSQEQLNKVGNKQY